MVEYSRRDLFRVVIGRSLEAAGVYAAARILSGCGGGSGRRGGGSPGGPTSTDDLVGGRNYLGKAVILGRRDGHYLEGRIIASTDLPDITKVRRVAFQFSDDTGNLTGFEGDLSNARFGKDANGKDGVSYVFPLDDLTGRVKGDVKLIAITTTKKDGTEIKDEPNLVVQVPSAIRSGLPTNSAQGYQIDGADRLLGAHKGKILVRYRGGKITLATGEFVDPELVTKVEVYGGTQDRATKLVLAMNMVYAVNGMLPVPVLDDETIVFDDARPSQGDILKDGTLRFTFDGVNPGDPIQSKVTAQMDRRYELYNAVATLVKLGVRKGRIPGSRISDPVFNGSGNRKQGVVPADFPDDLSSTGSEDYAAQVSALSISAGDALRILGSSSFKLTAAQNAAALDVWRGQLFDDAGLAKLLSSTF